MRQFKEGNSRYSFLTIVKVLTHEDVYRKLKYKDLRGRPIQYPISPFIKENYNFAKIDTGEIIYVRKSEGPLQIGGVVKYKIEFDEYVYHSPQYLKDRELTQATLWDKLKDYFSNVLWGEYATGIVIYTKLKNCFGKYVKTLGKPWRNRYGPLPIKRQTYLR